VILFDNIINLKMPVLTVTRHEYNAVQSLKRRGRYDAGTYSNSRIEFQFSNVSENYNK